MTEHTKLINEILLMIGKNFPRTVRAWQNRTGGLYTREGRLVRYGLNGSADILGIARQGIMEGKTDWGYPRPGTFLAIEVKVGRDKQSAEQKSFQAMIETFGGIFVLARSVEDVEKALEPYQHL